MGDAVVCDFGVSRILGTKGFTTESSFFSFRWVAKEVLFEGSRTREADIWSFGMTVLEVMYRAFFSMHVIEL